MNINLEFLLNRSFSMLVNALEKEPMKLQNLSFIRCDEAGDRATNNKCDKEEKDRLLLI